MVFYKGFRVVLLAAFCVFALVAADLNEEKEIALKKMNDQLKYIRKEIKFAQKEVQMGELALSFTFGDWMVLGFWRYEYAIIEVEKIAKSATLMAEFLGSSSEVFKCIDDHKKKASDDIEKYYVETYKDPISDLEHKFNRELKNIVRNWEDDYSAAIHENSKLHSKSVRDIEKATSEETISATLKNFEKSVARIVDIITSISLKLQKFLSEANQVADKFYDPFKQYTSNKVEETAKATQNCFPKFFRHEIFLH